MVTVHSVIARPLGRSNLSVFPIYRDLRLLRCARNDKNAIFRERLLFMKGRGKIKGLPVAAKAKAGFTLVEMLAVIAIIVLLVGLVVGIAKRIDDQSKERLCRSTIELVGNALEQFRDFGYEYKHTDFTGLAFPLDCNDYGLTILPPPNPYLPGTLTNAVYPLLPGVTINPTTVYSPEFSGSAALYFILNEVPDCRLTLGKIDKSLLTNVGTDKITEITITVITGAGNVTTPFTRIIDPWGTTLRYDYYPDFEDFRIANPTGTWGQYLFYRDGAKLTFPILTSAGPDKQFDTADDISNRKPK